MPKPSRSAFYFFALEYQSRGQRNNRQRMSINEAIAACYDDWKILSDEQKQPYKVLFEDWRLNYRANPEATTGSQPHIPNKKAIKQEMKNERILSERDIPCEELKIHYDRFSVERDYLAFEYLPLDIQELLSMPIYLINFQIFCKVDEEDGGQYVPAELCVLRVRAVVDVHCLSVIVVLCSTRSPKEPVLVGISLLSRKKCHRATCLPV